MEKRSNRKMFMSIALLMAVIIAAYFTVYSILNTNTAVAQRTVFLENSNIDSQSILNEFEDSEYTKEGNVADFVGYKSLDPSVFAEIDNLSETEKEEMAEECRVQYHFTYDSETNIVTISAEMKNEYGEIETDTISGVAFINDKNEIDAVLNIDGEGIMLSEMRDAGMIENCGWFRNLIRKIIKPIAIAVAVVATAVAIGAAIVVTCGAATPALVAAGVGVASTVVTAVTGAAITTTALCSYACLTAMIAAGVAITAQAVEQYYPGCGATERVENGTKVVTAQWSKTKTKEAIRDIVIAEKTKKNSGIYIHVTGYATNIGPTSVEIKGYTRSEMSANMANLSWSSLTMSSPLASSVIGLAFPGLEIRPHIHGMNHFHAVYPGTNTEAKGKNGLYYVHSFYTNLEVAK